MLETYIIWLFVALILIVFEVFGIFNFTALLSGAGAFCVALLLKWDAVGEDSYLLQASLFMAFSALFIALLWISPRRTSRPFNDIVGTEAVVITPPSPDGTGGLIRWSGTTLPARTESKTLLKRGQRVIITNIQGNTALIK